MKKAQEKQRQKFRHLHLVQAWQDIPIVRRAQLNDVSEPTQNILDTLSTEDSRQTFKRYGLSYITMIQEGMISIRKAYLYAIGAPDSIVKPKRRTSPQKKA